MLFHCSFDLVTDFIFNAIRVRVYYCASYEYFTSIVIRDLRKSNFRSPDQLHSESDNCYVVYRSSRPFSLSPFGNFRTELLHSLISTRILYFEEYSMCSINLLVFSQSHSVSQYSYNLVHFWRWKYHFTYYLIQFFILIRRYLRGSVTTFITLSFQGSACIDDVFVIYVFKDFRAFR